MDIKKYYDLLKNKSEFAEKVGISGAYLCQIAYGSRRPSPEVALQLEKESNGLLDKMELLYPKG